MNIRNHFSSLFLLLAAFAPVGTISGPAYAQRSSGARPRPRPRSATRGAEDRPLYGHPNRQNRTGRRLEICDDWYPRRQSLFHH